MDVKKIFLCLVLFFLYGMTVGFFQEKKVADRDPSSLIRKDLLPKERKSLAPPQRNIFTPQRGEYGLDRPVDAGVIEGQPGSKNITDGESPEPLIAPGIDIRYIGYIGSQERTVAIIIFNGDALAVEKGELISEHMKILEITPQSIKFEGSNSIPNEVFLEGEER